VTIIHHPQLTVIEEYASGELITPIALMISSHLEICPECLDKYKKIVKMQSSELAQDWEKQPDDFMDLAFNDILNKVSDKKEEDAEVFNETTLNVSNQVITLPRAFAFLEKEKISWKEFGIKNAIAPVATSPKGNLYLIYIGPGEKIPHHEHSGVEFSYVVAGSYSDENSHFSTGDFSILKNGQGHSPLATSSDGCFVISFVKGRLNYFSGIFKPLNSIMWWYLHKV
jgi:putative transcriptional regulator